MCLLLKSICGLYIKCVSFLIPLSLSHSSSLEGAWKWRDNAKLPFLKMPLKVSVTLYAETTVQMEKKELEKCSTSSISGKILCGTGIVSSLNIL